MNSKIFLTFISLQTLLITSSFASNESRAIESQKESSDILSKAMEVPGVSEQVKKCQSNNVAKENLSSCVWGGLSSEQQKQVQQVVNKTKDGKSLEGKYESVYTGSDNNKQSKGIKKLEDYLYNKLASVLFEETRKDSSFFKNKLVDEGVFYDLYETQVGKNIVSAFSSYCMDAHAGNDYAIKKDEVYRKENREKNIKSLGNFDASSRNSWNDCIVKVPKICHDKNLISEVQNSKDADEVTSEDIDYTQVRACEVVNYVKTAKQNLLAITKVKDSIKDLKVASKDRKSATPFYESKGKDKTIDDLTTVTSGEFVNETKYNDAQLEDAKILEECQKTGQITPECEAFLSDAGENEEQLIEQGLRAEALKNKLITDLEENPEKGLEQYFKDQGYSEEKIKELLAGDVDALKDMIKKRYETEKDALVKSLAMQLEKNQKSKSDDESTAKAENERKLDAIQKELTSKTSDYAQLIHFSNIVTGYLEVGGDSNSSGGARQPGSAKTSVNTYSISKELDNSAFTEEGLKKAQQAGIDIASGSGIKRDEAVKRLAEGGIEVKDSPDDAGSKTLQVQEINDVIEYDIHDRETD
ncbi:hypothetical protein HBN50_07290 [Halobacteriovorax sp. GB3]|uniref:hypothetical protein n=1 Tax=Halobacteriovorax sp. GB3 TaxID=2719615 RepID=UPI00235F834A|nr:hypothetical protein [Halobacteriovorax sp. GB3]MDD0852893.1 hypothetical protein [Halobacteriovorax sp. GB3]